MWLKNHPRGLRVLFITEAGERFGFYLMIALYTLYMSESLGYTEAQAASVYGDYLAAIYLTPILGGLVADRWLGYRRAVLLGSALLASGYLCLSAQRSFTLPLAMVLLSAGNGFFKANISTMVGKLYPPGDGRRDEAFGIFYTGVNVGALAGPLCGEAVRQRYGWTAAFAVAGLALVGSFVYFLLNRSHLASADTRDPAHPGPLAKLTEVPSTPSAPSARAPLTPEERHRVLALVVFSFIAMMFWMAFQQSGSTLTFWARGSTDRVITVPQLVDGQLRLLPWEIPPGMFSSVPAVFVILFAPASVWLFARLRARGVEISTPAKILIGMLLTGAAYSVMVAASLAGGDTGRVSLLWLLSDYFVISLAEVCISPMGLSMVTKLAPARYAGQLMGVWFLFTAIGNWLAGKVGVFWERWPHHRFFGMLVGSSLLAALVLLTQYRWLRRAMPDEGGRADSSTTPTMQPVGIGTEAMLDD